MIKIFHNQSVLPTFSLNKHNHSINDIKTRGYNHILTVWCMGQCRRGLKLGFQCKLWTWQFVAQCCHEGLPICFDVKISTKYDEYSAWERTPTEMIYNSILTYIKGRDVTSHQDLWSSRVFYLEGRLWSHISIRTAELNLVSFCSQTGCRLRRYIFVPFTNE